MAMNPRYRSTTEEQASAHIAEECAEVCAAFAKAQRWGWQSVNPELLPEQQETNHQWFLREVRDVSRSIQRFRELRIENMVETDSEREMIKEAP